MPSRCIPLHMLLIIALFWPIVDSCVLLLNGWTPVSVKDRAQSADIVISGQVIKAFKEMRTSADTYSAEVKILQIYKGLTLLKMFPETKVYNISNFGDKPACYADVFDGDNYIFFLTMFENRLSAKYDDIFGAATDLSSENEDEVLEVQGWDSWSQWTSCSKSCARGVRTRHRTCQLEEPITCEGRDTGSQGCNLFPCRGIKDLLRVFGVQKIPTGVEKVADRPNSFRIRKDAKLHSPTSSVFQGMFPVNFSISLGINLSPRFSGYLFTVSDSMEKQKIGIYYDSGEWRFDYYDQDGLPGVAAPTFQADLADGSWHLVGFRVEGQEITMFYDCKGNITKSLLRTRWPLININTILSIGPFFKQNGSPFEGLVDQLLISADPHTAGQQCSSEVPDGSDEEQKDGDSREELAATTIQTTHDRKQVTTELKRTKPFEWSAWSPCSATCGPGMQTRTLFCTNNQVEPSICIPRHIPRYQARRCYSGECSVGFLGRCRMQCLNGKRCDETGRCVCGAGYAGERCEIVSCFPGCYNGGQCIEPSVCRCPPGYNGALCEKAICDPPCRNGGYCISPGQCSCPYGYLAPDCAPFCTLPCQNGGTCIGGNMCLCRPGYTGRTCERAVCNKGCFNGGRCIGPNMCSCRSGYSGKQCESAICNPPCQNGGVCGLPYQCLCNPGTLGWYCEHFICSKRCKHGGVCVGPNKCSCPPGYRGSKCQRRACRGGCFNGGRCINKRKCRCPPGFRGKRCQKKKCKVERHLEPYVRNYRRSVREKFSTRCGPWLTRKCFRTRLKKITVSKEFYRTSYQCA